MIEILTLNLRPGTRDRFHEIYLKESLPLQRKWKINVVAHGPSLHDDNSYWATRSFSSLEDRERLEEAFYASDDWQKGPRTAILSMIESLSTVVVSSETLEQWIERSKETVTT